MGFQRIGRKRRILTTSVLKSSALACRVRSGMSAELRLLEEVRHELDIDRLAAAAIERGARARHVT